MAPLLPKLRGHFAEFLNNTSPAGLRILSSSTCVGLWYGYIWNNSGFSWQPAHVLRYLYFAPRHGSGICCGFAYSSLLRLDRSLHSRLTLSFCVPTVLSICSTGISTCYPSTTTLVLALGPDLPRADQLYSGNLGYSAWGILTPISLLIPAFSLPNSPLLLPVQLRSIGNAPLPTLRFRSFGIMFQPRTFSAQDLSTSELLRTL